MKPHNISAFYIDKQKSFVPRKKVWPHVTNSVIVTWGVTNRDVLLLATLRHMTNSTLVYPVKMEYR